MFDVKKAPIKIITDVKLISDVNYANRLMDWREELEHLSRLSEKHKEKYRMQVCVRCSDEQQIERGCVAIDELDSNNNLKTSCMHMCRSANRKLADRVYKHIEFHPMWPKND